MLTAKIHAVNFLNFDYHQACKLLLGDYQSVQLALIGCGGTGSWLAPAICRIGRLLKEKEGKPVEIAFIDPDVVEAKNVYRQNFCEAEIGRNKAETLAWRFGLSWGLEIQAFGAPFSPEMSGEWRDSRDLLVLIGCVDNPKGRRAIQQAARRELWRKIWWLDCGNSQSSGQALLGSGKEKPGNPFSLPGLCSWLPLPSDQHPELVHILTPPLDLPQIQEQDLGRGNGLEMSCAEMALLDAQGMMVNQRMAAEAGDMLTRMLITKDLTRFATYFDLASGSARSRYITPEEVLGGKAD